MTSATPKMFFKGFKQKIPVEYKHILKEENQENLNLPFKLKTLIESGQSKVHLKVP